MITRLAWLALLVVAACNSKAPAPGQGTPRDSGKRPTVPIDAAAPTPDANPQGTAMTPEALLQDHYAKGSYGKPINIVAYPHVPGFYRSEWADGLDHALVQHGALVTAKGVDAMAAYMTDVDLLSQQGLTVDDLLTLIEFFKAYASQYLADGYYMGKEHADLQTRFELDAGAGHLTIYYITPNQGGPLANPTVVQVARVTLTIAKDYKLTWKSEPMTFDTAHP